MFSVSEISDAPIQMSKRDILKIELENKALREEIKVYKEIINKYVPRKVTDDYIHSSVPKHNMTIRREDYDPEIFKQIVDLYHKSKSLTDKNDYILCQRKINDLINKSKYIDMKNCLDSISNINIISTDFF